MGTVRFCLSFGMTDNSQYMFLRWVKWSKLYSNDLNGICPAGGFCGGFFFFFWEKLNVDSISICGVLRNLFKVLNMPSSSSLLTRGNFHNGWHIRNLLKERGSDFVLSRRSNFTSVSYVAWDETYPGPLVWPWDMFKLETSQPVVFVFKIMLFVHLSSS